MTKPLIFISHIHQEKELAFAFKELIETSFLGVIEIFVSSDGDSILLGEKWLDIVTEKLKACTMEFLLCSPYSINSPWINFEAGAGWIRDIPVIPLCHSGITPSKLPNPLNHLQAAICSESSNLKLLFSVIAMSIGSRVPNIDFKGFLEKTSRFEREYTFWTRCNECLSYLYKLCPDVLMNILSDSESFLEVNESGINILLDLMDFLTPNKIMKMEPAGGATFTSHGALYKYRIYSLEKFKEIIWDQRSIIELVPIT